MFEFWTPASSFSWSDASPTTSEMAGLDEAKAYMAKREIPQLFEVRISNDALVTGDESICFA